MVLLGAAIAMAGICAAAKPLLIKYHLYKYGRASSRFSRLYDTSSEASQLAADLQGRVNSMHALYRLDYLAAYEIPITNPRDDAEAALAQFASISLMYQVPASVKIVRAAPGTVLRVMDRPENKPNWAWIADFYLEQTPEQQMNDPNHKGPIMLNIPLK